MSAQQPTAARPPACCSTSPRRRSPRRPVVAARSSAGCSGSIPMARPRPGNPARPANAVSSRCCVDGIVQRIRARPRSAIRLGRCNTVSGISFFLGGGLFTLGAVLSAAGRHLASTINWCSCAGGFFFSTGAYASMVQEINSPRSIDADGSLAENRWRWWAYEPNAARLGRGVRAVLSAPWPSPSAWSTSSSSRPGAPADDQLIWAPEMVGCVLFLVSGHVGIIEEICHGRFRLMPRSLGWWMVASISSGHGCSSSPGWPPTSAPRPMR